ncbi:MAG: hypothetical protein ABI921_09825 [Panacibacter sp.]
MKLFETIFALCFTFAITACSGNKTVVPVNQKEGLVGLSLLLNQNSAAGLAGLLESINEVSPKGINLFGMSPEWPQLEPAALIYSLQDQIVNPLTLTDPGKTNFKSYILVLKMIDTQRKTVPSDLSALSFDDPAVISRFKSLIDNLSELPSISRVSHILIGNEVDGYLSANPAALSAFSTFYKASIAHIHTKMPQVKVGTIITFNSLTDHPEIFNTLTPSSDFICYTYYPTDNTNPNWEMRPPTDAIADIALMAQKAGDKPFAFTEIGYSSSIENNSSETLQKQFVENMFDALQPYKDEGKLAFIFYHGLYDYPPDFCSGYAQSQGIDPAYLCGFMNNLGLKNYITGQPKEAFDAFFNKLADW